jgi:hypothetical protein
LLASLAYGIAQNLTTNESIHIDRYAYLKDPATGKFRNPFDRGSLWGNFQDVFFPSIDYFNLFSVDGLWKR